MRIVRNVAAFVAVAGLYMWCVAAPSRDELIAAVICAAIVIAFMQRVSVLAFRQRGKSAPRADPAGFGAIIARVPLAVVRESFDILGPTLWRGLVRRESVRGRWIALRYEPDDGSDGYGRRALVIFGSGITPNAFPLCVDDVRGRLYLHQLVARREAAADHPRYPI